MTRNIKIVKFINIFKRYIIVYYENKIFGKNSLCLFILNLSLSVHFEYYAFQNLLTI